MASPRNRHVVYLILLSSWSSSHPRISKFTDSSASHPLRWSLSPSNVLGSRILGLRVLVDKPVPSALLDVYPSFCLEVIIVFLQVLVGVSSSEFWGSCSESEDTGLAVEKYRAASAKASLRDVTSIPPCVRSSSGVSFGGNAAVFC